MTCVGTSGLHHGVLRVESDWWTRMGVGEQRNSYGTRSITAPLLPNTQSARESLVIGPE